MTTPKEALEAVLSFLDELTMNAAPGKRQALNPITIGGSAKLYAEGLRASLQGEDAVERVARTICQSGKFETGQGTCALICMDQLGDVRKKGCGHCTRVHGAMARAILAAGLVPDEAAVRADEREKCAKIAEDNERQDEWPLHGSEMQAPSRRMQIAIAAAIRSNQAKP